MTSSSSGPRVEQRHGRPGDLLHLGHQAERLHRTCEDTPDGIAIDATAPLAQVVDEIASRIRQDT